MSGYLELDDGGHLALEGGGALLISEGLPHLQPPVRPPYQWRWAVGDWPLPGPTSVLNEARARKLTFKRQGGAVAAFNIDGRSPEASDLTELVTDLHVWRDGVKMFRGRLGGIGDDIDQDKHATSVTAGDYRNVLDRRLILPQTLDAWDELIDNSPWTNDEASLVSFIINATQAMPAGNLNLVEGVGFPFLGRTAPDVTFQAGQTLTAAIDSMAKSDPTTSGFDWEIDANLRVNLWAGKRGTLSNVALDYGGNVTKVTRTTDPSDFANYVRFIAGTEGSGVSTNFPITDIEDAPQGLWQDYVTRPDIILLTFFDAWMKGIMDDKSQPGAAYSVQLVPNWWKNRSTIWLGDTVSLAIRSGRLNVVEELVVEEIDIDIDDTGVETVTLKCDRIYKGVAQKFGDLVRNYQALKQALANGSP